MNKDLPIEIINKILITRSPHPINEIIKSNTESYQDYTENDDYISFCKYLRKYKFLYYHYNIKLTKKRNNDILICHGCDYHIQCNDLYIFNSHSVYCRPCYRGMI